MANVDIHSLRFQEKHLKCAQIVKPSLIVLFYRTLDIDIKIAHAINVLLKQSVINNVISFVNNLALYLELKYQMTINIIGTVCLRKNSYLKIVLLYI